MKGFSVIEVLIATAIVGIVLTLAATSLLRTQKGLEQISDKTDESAEMSLLKIYAKKSLKTAGMFSVGVLQLNATEPTTGDRGFFDYYKNYPIHLLSKEQQTRTLRFKHTDPTDSQIHFLQPYEKNNGDFEIDPLKLYAYSENQLEGTTHAIFNGNATLKNQIPYSIRSDFWKRGNFLLFYVPLFFSVSGSDLSVDRPVKMYARLGVVGNSNISFNSTFSGLLSSVSPAPGDNTNLDTLQKVIEHTPLVGGNSFKLTMTRVQWLTFLFKKGEVVAGKVGKGKLYRCVNDTNVSNLNKACTESKGELVLSQVEEITFKRAVDSANISIDVKL